MHVPNGFDASYPQADLLKLRSYIVWIKIPVLKDLGVPDKKLRDASRDGCPLIA